MRTKGLPQPSPEQPWSVQIENAALRSNQSVLLAEMVALRRELAALGQHAGLELGGPSRALHSILQPGQGLQSASSSGAPQSSGFLVCVMVALVVSLCARRGRLSKSATGPLGC